MDKSLNWIAPWAKLGRGVDAIYPHRFHPVAYHLLDVGFCAMEIWNQILRPKIKRDLATRFGCSVEHLGRWFAFVIALHDIGKLWPGFQSQGNGAVNALTSLGYPFPRTANNSIKHALVSTKWMIEVLPRGLGDIKSIDRRLVTRLAYALGGHHGLFPRSAELNQVSLKGIEWEQSRQQMAIALAREFGVLGLDPPEWNEDDDPNQSPFVIFAGLTAVADWIGSNEDHFPWRGESRSLQVDPCDELKKYAEESRMLADQAMTMIGWKGLRTGEAGHATWSDIFGQNMTPRPLQSAAVKLVEELHEPGIVLAEAPMGEGKTEFAFFLMDHWLRNVDAQGLYVALPTQATTNAMFGRLCDFLDSRPHGSTNIHLLHGRAIINNAYGQLQSAAFADDHDDANRDEISTRLIAERWFAADKKQAMLAPFGVGTIDQSLLSVLQVRHGFVRLFGLAGKVVIFDEVHAYDAYMSTILERLLTWLGAMGSSVILLSATLPASRRKRLLEAYLLKEGLDTSFSEYPRLTYGDAYRAETIPITSDPSRRRKIALRQDITEENLVTNLKAFLSQGGSIAVIRNTVGAAQETYQSLKESLPGVTVILFHARFVFEDRDRIEKEVLRLFGRDRHAKGAHILVATQVIEQSLDLDFDLMVSDWAPVDLLLQRMGRLWRHHRSDRPKSFVAPTFWLIEPREFDSLKPSFGTSEFVYEPYILLGTYLVLKDRSALTIPDNIDGLIEDVYGDDQSVPEEYEAAYKSLRKSMREDIDFQTLEARSALFPSPIQEDDILREPTLDFDEDDPNVHPKRIAKTRDALPSVTTIFLYAVEGTHFFDAACTRPISLAKVPNKEITCELLMRSATISNQHYVRTLFKRDPQPTWEKNGLLRFCRLMTLDTLGQSLDEEIELTVDHEYGIRYDKKQFDEGSDR